MTFTRLLASPNLFEEIVNSAKKVTIIINLYITTRLAIPFGNEAGCEMEHREIPKELINKQPV